MHRREGGIACREHTRQGRMDGIDPSFDFMSDASTPTLFTWPEPPCFD